MRLGDLRIDAVLDGTSTLAATQPLVRPGSDGWAAHRDLLTGEGLLELPVGSFLVRTGSGWCRSTQDTAATGPYRGGQLPANLAALGWTTSKGRIVFPNATYRCHEDGWAHFVTAPAAEPDAVRKLSPLEPQTRAVQRRRDLGRPGSTPAALRATRQGRRSSCSPAEPGERCWQGTRCTARSSSPRTTGKQSSMSTVSSRAGHARRWPGSWRAAACCSERRTSRRWPSVASYQGKGALGSRLDRRKSILIGFQA